jgi:glycosyltransferase involved in cell wall biosynthesis
MDDQFVKNLQSMWVEKFTSQTNPLPQMEVAAQGAQGAQGAQAAGTQHASQSQSQPLRLLYVGTHTHQVTGYSKVSHGILSQLAQHPWLQVTHFAFQKYQGELPQTRKQLVNTIDVGTLDKQPNSFGFTQLPAVIQKEQPHIVFIYNDLSVISQFMEAIKRAAIPRTFQIWLYIDQVYTTQHAAYIDMINKESDRIFVFTEGWRNVLKEQGVHRPIDILLHGFDADTFKPIEKAVARKALGLTEDLFLITSLNRNQPRKRLDILIMSFVELIAKYPNKPIALMCVCDKGDKGGWWLFEIYARELKLRNLDVNQFGNRLMVTSKDMIYTDDEINIIYNAADIGISCAEGEGFGLCSFEQMGIGIPQVVPAVGGYVEYCNKTNAQLVEPSWRYYLPTVQCPVGGEARVCDPHNVCLAVEEYLLNSELRLRHGTAAAATVAKYTWLYCVKNLVRRLQREWEDINDI